MLAVNGISLINLSYEESIRLLRNTGRIVELTVSQIYQNFENKLKPRPAIHLDDDDRLNGKLAKNQHKSMHELTNKETIQSTDFKHIHNNECESNDSGLLKTAKSMPNLSSVRFC